MRRCRVALVGMLVVVAGGSAAGCSSKSEDAVVPRPTASTTSVTTATSLESLGIDWPRGARFDVADPPPAPDGFGDDLVARMAAVLVPWAEATTVDQDVWHGGEQTEIVSAVLPPAVATRVREQAADAASPRLAVANVFADEVEVRGRPAVTTAWKISTQDDEQGASYLRLELQTRAAYEVRIGDGPSRVIGVLRVHGLSAYPATTSDFGVSTGWQEFGAGDCALALDDELIPAAAGPAANELSTFVDVGDQPDVRMPALAEDERVDGAYLDRCRNGMT